MLNQKECLYCKNIFTLQDKKNDKGNFIKAKYCNKECCWSDFKGEFNDYKIIDNMVEIYIKDKIVLIDLDDLWKVSDYRWYLANTGYASTGTSLKNKLLHHLIILNKTKKGMVIDHINRNKLDNRKINLRYVSSRINARNTKVHSHNTSGVKGVFFSKKDNRWVARMILNNRQIHLGQFKDKDLAIKARLDGELKYWGEHYA